MNFGSTPLERLPAAALRAAFSTFATGVTIVSTCDADGRAVGVTANSFSSVSLEPPLVLWSLSRKARSLDAFSRCGFFAVSVLSGRQGDLAVRFSSAVPDRFSGVRVRKGRSGTPLVEDAITTFECRSRRQYEEGDHVIFIGEVIDFGWASMSEPLVFHRNQLLALGAQGPLRTQEQPNPSP